MRRKAASETKPFHAAVLKREKSSQTEFSSTPKPEAVSLHKTKHQPQGLILLKNQMACLRINGHHKLTNKT